ncbi:MAG TPA: DUF6531 domain-containing protein, partial [Burkholderiaceae bacterium]|nr:DUF6531 domain-containing protein [Burkholderiaceae bacterium]
MNSSRFTVGAAGELGQGDLGRAGERITVNAANGNLVIQNQDGQVAGIGADIALLRTYNSQGGWDGDNGDAWRLGYYRRISGLTGTLNAAGSTLCRTDADGFESSYAWRDGRYVSTDGAGAYDSLTVAGGVATWTDGDTGLAETYAESAPGTWRLTQITDAEGHSIKLAYDTQGLIASLSTWKAGAASADETLTLAYDAARRLTQVSTATRRADASLATQTRTRYSYDSANRLTGVLTDLSPEDNSTVDERTYRVAYTYDSAGRVRTVTQTDRSALTIDYDRSGRVSQLTDALGHVTTFSYDTSARQTTITDALNQTTRLSYDSAGRLTDLSGTGFGTSLAYDADGNVLSCTNGLGQQTRFAYDSQGNLVRSTDATGRVLERGYDAANRQTSETQGAQTTRYVYDTTSGLRRLRFTVSAEGRVNEQQYNSLGQVTSRLSYSRSVYTGAATLADLAAWASQQTDPQRTDNSYDLRGQLASRLDAAGLTRFTYDAFGRLLQSIDAGGNATAYVYDGLDRLVLSTDALGVATTYEYSGSRMDVQLVSRDGQTPGLRTISIHNPAGLLITTAQFSGSTPLGETRHAYDAANRLCMTQDPTGQRQWMLYDEAGRKVGDVNALGHLIETRYDAAGRAVQSIGYEQPVNTALLVDAQGNPANTSLAAVRPAPAAGDRRQWQLYDAAGRLTHQINSLGEVTETQYDGAGRIGTVVQHGRRLSALPAPGSIDLPVLAYAAGEPDRITRNLYDADGLLRGTLDAEGYLIEMRYDAAGRQVERIAYATATDPGLRATGTLAQLIPAAHGSDRRSVWLHDSQGRIKAEVDPDGYLTETTYNAAGQRTLRLRYARRITGVATPTRTLANLRPAASPDDQGTRWTYDALGRVKTETAADGTQTRYSYDKVGNLTSTERAVGTAEVRSHNARYDAQGRLTAELSAEGAARLANALTQEQIDAVWMGHATRHAYDAAGRRIRSTDARGSTTVFYYDAAGRQVYRILKTAEGGEVQASRYNAFSETAQSVRYTRRLGAADAAALTGGLVDATLDSLVAALADAGDLRSQTTYNQRGLIQQAIDALGHRTDYQYNAFGQLSRSDAAAGSLGDGRALRTDLAYDGRGLLTTTTQDPLGLKVQTRTGYDAFGRAVASVDARGNRTSTEYRNADASLDGGRQVIVTDAAGAIRSTTYDAFDRVVRQTDALGGSITFRHDSANRRVTMTTATGITTVTESNRHGQVVRLTDGTGATTTHTYDANGNLVTSTDALGQVSTRSYDQAGNLVMLLAPDHTGQTRYEYDAANRLLIQTVDPDGLRLKTTTTYDGQGRAVRVTDAAGSVTSYTFNARGELQEVTRDDRAGGLQLKTRTTHDAQGRTLSVTEGAGTAAARTTEYRYDLLGRCTHEIVDPAGLQLTTRYEFDAAGNMVFKRDALGG